MSAAVVFLLFFICLIIAIPISIALGIVSVLPGAFDPSFTASGTFVIRSMLGGIDSFPLLAVPMFVLSGMIMAKGGISKKIFDVFAFFIGKLTAGMPCAVIVTCLFYGAISGSAPATVAAVVSTQNNGAISCLDDDSIVEVSSIISATGAQPMAFGKLPSAEKGWLQMMKAMEECTIEAALTGDYGKALEAFVLNPLVENNENTTKVLDELLVAHAKYLPQFKEKIEELKAKGVHSTDPVVMDLMEHGH